MIAPKPARGIAGGALGALFRLAPLRWPASDRPYIGDLIVPDSDRRLAIVSTVTDNFVGLGAAFLLSLHETLANRAAVDVILLQSPGIAPLGAENRARLSALCPGLRIVDVDVSGFLNAENMRRYDKHGRAVSIRRDTHELPSKIAAYVKLNVLRLTQYDKVLLMDSDMMVIADFSEIFDLPHDIAAVPTGKARPDFAGSYSVRGRRRRKGFNSGFLLLSDRVRGEGAFNAALDFLDQKQNRVLRDQSILNHIFVRAEAAYLPHMYNHKLRYDDPGMLADAAALTSAKVIHFVGPTKFGLKRPEHAGEAIYDSFHALQARTGMPFTLEP